MACPFASKQKNPEDPIYHRLDQEYEKWPDLKGRFTSELQFLQEQNHLTFQPYKSQWRTDPNILEIHLLPKGLEFLQNHKVHVKTVTETVTKTVTEAVVESEPQWKKNEHRRQFLRTERGYGIMNSQLDDFLDSIKSKVMKIRRGDLPAKDMKCLQIWLDRALEFRGSDVPSDLKAEARDCRDLPVKRRFRS